MARITVDTCKKISGKGIMFNANQQDMQNMKILEAKLFPNGYGTMSAIIRYALATAAR